jgi:hypothetical protein
MGMTSRADRVQQSPWATTVGRLPSPVHPGAGYRPVASKSPHLYLLLIWPSYPPSNFKLCHGWHGAILEQTGNIGQLLPHWDTLKGDSILERAVMARKENRFVLLLEHNGGPFPLAGRTVSMVDSYRQLLTELGPNIDKNLTKISKFSRAHGLTPSEVLGVLKAYCHDGSSACN